MISVYFKSLRAKTGQMALTVILLLSMGQETALGESQAQMAYDTCVRSYNNGRSSLPLHWAFVAGVSFERGSCYWTFRSSSGAEAAERAFANCRRDYSHCFLYADSQRGHQPWAQHISENGGLDRGTRRDSSGASSPTATLGTMPQSLNFGAAARAEARSQMGPVTGSGGGTTSCAPGYHLFGGYGQKFVCQPNASGGPGRGPSRSQSTLTGF